MDTVLEYMAKLHPSLNQDYRDLEGKKIPCDFIAEEIFKRIKAEGGDPFIGRVRGKVYDGFNRRAVFPVAFNGRISWGLHFVCCEGDLAYDPMLDASPVPIENYCREAFKGEVDIDFMEFFSI